MSETGRDTLVSLDAGRSLTVREYGDPRGRPVVALHGTPASRLMFTAADADARQLGLRILAPDRWGYGDTPLPSEQTLAAFAAEIGLMGDRLGVGQMAVLGVSGGGPYAAAVAAELGARVNAVALVSPVGPIHHLPPMDLSAFHRLCFKVLPGYQGVLSALFGSYRFLLANAPRTAMAIATSRSPGADRKLIADANLSRRLSTAFREGMRQGVAGPLLDMRLFGRPWDVNVGEIAAPAHVWIGRSDTNVPVAAAIALAQAIPGCQLTHLDAGHLWVANKYATVLGWIAQAIDQRAA